MRTAHLPLLCCPACHGDLTLAPAARLEGERVVEGWLACPACRTRHEVRGGVPRFVPSSDYAGSFGFQWLRHARTQLDDHLGAPVSRRRFFAETRWPERLEGERVLEVGCGAGRFTGPAASTGATVVSVDLSVAVEANHATNGARENVLIVQADLRRLPVRPGSFDRLFCFGVLQHTPDPAAAFAALPALLRPGGRLAVDCYVKSGTWRDLLMTKYWARPVTKRVPPGLLYRACEAWVRGLWAPLGVTQRRLGNWFSWLLLVSDYRGLYDLPDARLREWAVLDTFDSLSPAHDHPQTLDTVQRWFEDAGLVELDVHHGHNGIEGRGVRPGPSLRSRA